MQSIHMSTTCHVPTLVELRFYHMPINEFVCFFPLLDVLNFKGLVLAISFFLERILKFMFNRLKTNFGNLWYGRCMLGPMFDGITASLVYNIWLALICTRFKARRESNESAMGSLNWAVSRFTLERDGPSI